MAYFLKKTRNKKGLYLQIYESHWDPVRRHTAHTSVKVLGYVDDLKGKGMEDPEAHYRAEVARMNAERKAGVEGEGAREITDVPATRHLGHFALKAVDDALGTAEDMALLQAPSGFRFPLADLLSSLAYARAVAPRSKLRTSEGVLPQMEGVDARFTPGQPCDGLAYLGDECERVVEICNAHVEEAFGRDMSSAHFDCTNLYFEIDREDGFRRKGPSREHRPEPIVGMGLLLDADCIPVAMSLFPGSESEGPQLGRCIAQMRERGSMSGRTVRVADKGLDCAANIAEAVLAGDGYIFSKSARALPAKERAWALSADGWTDVPDGRGGAPFRYKVADGDFEYAVEGEGGRRRKAQLPERRVVTYSPSLAKKQTYEISRQVEKARSLRAAAARRSEYGDSARYVTFSPVDGEGEVRGDVRVAATLNHEAIRKAKAVAGYDMIVTSETGMDPRAIYDTHHRLWRIEGSLGVMRSGLDARPVCLQRQSAASGHFLVCHVAVLPMRLPQARVLGDRFSSEDVMGLCRGLDVCRTSDRRYANVSRRSPVIEELAQRTGLPLLHFNLAEGDVRAISSCTLSMLRGEGKGPSAGRKRG